MVWKGKQFGWGVATPYLTYLPDAVDASINVLREIKSYFESGEDLGSSLDISLNLLEPPSVELATNLMLRVFQSDMKIVRKIERIPKPDPRKSKSNIKLWKYWRKSASPALRCPSENIRKTCARLAAQKYDYESNWQVAGQLSAKGTPALIPEILAVMVYPPDVHSKDVEPWTWLQRIQLAAAQLVAQIESRHQIPLDQSALTDLLRGTIDWTMDAAVVAQVQRIRMDGLDGTWFAGQLFDLVERLPKEGYWSPLETALENYLLIPGLDSESCDTVRQILVDIQSEGELDSAS